MRSGAPSEMLRISFLLVLTAVLSTVERVDDALLFTAFSVGGTEVGISADIISN